MVRTESRALKTTSKATRLFLPLPFRDNRGFTLVEILIVVAIVAMVMSMGLPAIQRVTYQRLNSTTRKFVGLVRSVRNDAVLLNGIYRIAFDLEKNRWWVETQKSFEMLTEPMEAPPPKKKRRDEEEEVGPSGNFGYAEKYTNKPLELPGGVVFNGVLKESEGLRTGGVAYIHFFPNGYNEQAVVYLNKDGAESGGYSLVIRPTGGRVEILGDKVEAFD